MGKCAMAKTLFETIGHRLGQKVAQARNAFDLMGGTEEDSLHAEIRLGRDLEAALLERIPLVEENETGLASKKRTVKLVHLVSCFGFRSQRGNGNSARCERADDCKSFQCNRRFLCGPGCGWRSRGGKPVLV